MPTVAIVFLFELIAVWAEAEQKAPSQQRKPTSPSFDFQSGGALFGSSLKPAALKKLLESI